MKTLSSDNGAPDAISQEINSGSSRRRRQAQAHLLLVLSVAGPVPERLAAAPPAVVVPGLVVAGVAVVVAVASVVVARPQRAWRWARRGFFVWRGWQAIRNKLVGVR